MSGRLPLRLRVTAVFATVAAIALVVLGLFVLYRVDTTLTAQAHLSLDAQADALAALTDAARADAIAGMTGEYFAQVINAPGTVAVSSPQLSGEAALDPSAGTGQSDVYVEQPVFLRQEGEEEAAVVLLRTDGDEVLLVGTSREDLDDALVEVRNQLLVGGPLALVLASIAGYIAAGSALRPMDRMRRHADAISARSSGERLPLPPARDEVYRLGRTLNQMLDRLDAGLQRERRFVAEASHELRTPLAMLKLELDLALAQPRPPNELVAALRSAGEEVDRLTALSRDLLLLASTEGQLGHPGADVTELEVGRLLGAVAARFSSTALEQGRHIVVTCEAGLAVRGHPGHLERAVANLVDNAIRHGAGDIDLRAGRRADAVTLQVSDHGPGIDEAFQTQAFEPFSRGLGPRPLGSRGLGLAIVRALVAEAHGTVTLENRNAGGLVATITFADH